jgi:hypothetical protein
MSSYISKLILFSLAVIMLCFAVGVKTQAFDLFGNPCKNDGTVRGGTGVSSPVCETSQGPQGNRNKVIDVIREAANILAFIGGVAAVIVIIISGLSFATSGGNSEQVANARRRIIYSLVGLVVIALAWTIARFVTDNVIK